MRTGVTVMGHHIPRHIASDLDRLAELGCDDVLVAAQENDFVYMRGKLEFLPGLARERGLRPVAIFWGALNVFGGGKSSQFLLEHPECHQVGRDGSWHRAGCYVNPASRARIFEMIDFAVARGFEAYFVDEPTPLSCFCRSCTDLFASRQGKDLFGAAPDEEAAFRRSCVTDYIRDISAYVKEKHPHVETMACLMPQDRECWGEVARVPALDNLGTDIYWVNDDIDVEEMRPLVREMAELCRDQGKRHHEWLQCWGTRRGREHRIVEQGSVLLEEGADGLYVWAFEGQVGTSETCEDPSTAWKAACQILRRAKTG